MRPAGATGYRAAFMPSMRRGAPARAGTATAAAAASGRRSRQPGPSRPECPPTGAPSTPPCLLSMHATSELTSLRCCLPVGMHARAVQCAACVAVITEEAKRARCRVGLGVSLEVGKGRGDQGPMYRQAGCLWLVEQGRRTRGRSLRAARQAQGRPALRRRAVLPFSLPCAAAGADLPGHAAPREEALLRQHRRGGLLGGA